MKDMSSNSIFLRLYWWTQGNLIPISGFPNELPPLDAELLAYVKGVKAIKVMIKGVLRVPTTSEVFVVPEGRQVPVCDESSLQDLASGKFGEVSEAKPLRILVAGHWTVGMNEESSVAYDAWLRQIDETGFLPLLPPIDKLAKFTAYPIYASTLEDWFWEIQRFLAEDPITPSTPPPRSVSNSLDANRDTTTELVPPRYEALYPA